MENIKEREQKFRALQLFRRIRTMTMRNSLFTFILSLVLAIFLCMRDAKGFILNLEISLLLACALAMNFIVIAKEFQMFRKFQRHTDKLGFIADNAMKAIRFPLYANIATIFALIICFWSIIGLIVYLFSFISLLFSFIILISMEDAMREQLLPIM